MTCGGVEIQNGLDSDSDMLISKRTGEDKMRIE